MDDHTHHSHADASHRHENDSDRSNRTRAEADMPFTDPVCGMKVAADPDKKIEYEGINYYFCSTRCMDKFRADPLAYIHKETASSPASSSTHTCCGMHHDAEPCTATDNRHVDPVCGMKVEPDPSKSIDYEGKTYYFCSQSCMAKFKENPRKYLQPKPEASSAAETPASKKVMYTCPMHPQIQQIGPGNCPICGMALEPMEASAAQDTTELRDMTRRFQISLALTVPLLAVSMSEFIPGLNLHHRMGINAFNWLQAILATPVVLWGGWPFFVRGWASFRTWNLNMFTLIAIGTAAAQFFSYFALLFPAALPDAFKVNGMVPLYFEAAAVIVTLVLLGQVLELRARSRTNSAIKSLLELAPNTALRINPDGSEQEIHLDQVHAGDRLRVKPGGENTGRRRDSGRSFEHRRVDDYGRAHSGGKTDR